MLFSDKIYSKETTMYYYDQLETADSLEADAYNATLLNESTLGIEVTAEHLAVLCGLGNIDPQHNGNRGLSAIEEALTHPLPPDGSRLVTLRLDKDSVGAMAVLRLRHMCQADNLDRCLITWIGAIDRLGFVQARADHPELMCDERVTSALQVIATRIDGRWPTLESRVIDTGRILTRAMSRQEIDTYAALKVRPSGDYEFEMYGPLAVVRAPGAYGFARDWANRRFAVALIFDPEFKGEQRRSTLVRWPGYFDRLGFEKSINAAEAWRRKLSSGELKARGFNWGGTVNLISSPAGLGRDSALPENIIISIARSCAESGKVS
jgi:hypothetical protein